MEKKEKKGFWASLFSSKPNACSCGDAYVVHSVNTEDKTAGAAQGGCCAIKDIKVLGPGCSKCKNTYAVVDKVVKECGMDVQLTKVDDIEEIMRYNILSTPAIVVDDKVVLKGRVPSEKEVKQLLGL